MSEKYQKPGEKPKGAGEYKEVGFKGEEVRNARVVSMDATDDHLPPTQEEGHKWKKIK